MMFTARAVIVAVVRSRDSLQLVEVARALADGGVSVIEITMTVPDALDVVRAVRKAIGPDIRLGVDANGKEGPLDPASAGSEESAENSVLNV